MTSEDVLISDEQLKEVDKVFQIVQQLSSTDKDVVQKACQDAEDLLQKREGRTCFDKTSINSSSQSKDVSMVNGGATADTSAFMAAVAQDADARAKRRAKQRERAEKIKERANAFFKAGDWKRSIELYTQAIEVSKDWDVLYTNRAQAYLRLGQAEEALKDCEAAIFLIPNPNTDSNDSTSGQGDLTVPNPRLAKAYLHKGKALMALNQPSKALDAYSLSRSHSNSKSDAPWPPYLAEYVVQAEAALIAQAQDAKAAADFKACAIGLLPSNMTDNPDNSLPLKQQVICLLAQLARANQTQSYYAAGLRQLCHIFSSVPRQSPVSEIKPSPSEPNQNHQLAVKEPLPAPKQTTNPPRSNNKKKRSGAKSKSSKSQPQIDGTTTISTEKPTKAAPSSAPEILSDLQTVFRLASGLTLMEKEVNSLFPFVDWKSHDESELETKQNDAQLLDAFDRLLALLNFAEQITLDCAENQRLLIERAPKLVRICLQFIEMPLKYLEHLVLVLEKTEHQYGKRLSHLLAVLRAASCAVLASLTSSPSGRQALLDITDPVSLLTAIASCLSSCLCPNQSMNAIRHHPNAAKLSSLIGTSTASVCATRAADVLDHMTESSRFLNLAKTADQGLDCLFSVVESVLLVANPSPSSRLTATTAHCLSKILDSLNTPRSNGDPVCSMLYRNAPLVNALIESLSRHTPLLDDPNHAHLVRSICRLLHNFCVIHLAPSNWTGEEYNSTQSTFFSTKPALVQSLLKAVGAILDHRNHGPELRAIVVSLAGRLLFTCQMDQVGPWFGDSDPIDIKEHNPTLCASRLSERSRLLLAILDSCSPPPNEMTQPKDATESCTTESSSTSEDSSSALLLGGCVRCLAAGTKHSVNLRYAIGDDKRRVRRLARLIRAHLPPSAQPPRPSKPKSNVFSAPSPLRNEALAGNACLVLETCSSDTPLAEYLQGTSVILDLLSLIQESKKNGTKRNAAILIGKLAQASQVHRDELSRLKGWNVISQFNSWSSGLWRNPNP